MKHYPEITFFEGLLVALIGSITGSVSFFAFSSVFSSQFSLKLLITGLSFFYIIYLLARSKDHIGRLTIILLWSMITIALWFFWLPISLYLLIQLSIIWLIRSIYYYSSLLSTVVDFGLSLASMAIALWVFNFTSSLFLTLWCFFLTQALFVMIPPKMTQHKINHKNSAADFQRSYRVAEAAITKLSNNH